MYKYIIATLLLTFPAHATEFQTAFSPHQGATQLIVSEIQGSKQSIHAEAYGFSNRPIINALCQAVSRGVTVQVVVDKSQAQGKMPAFAKSCGVQVRFNYNYSIMHNKVILIDDNTISVGSFNFTAAAESRNAENVLQIKDAPANVINAYEGQFQKLWGEGR